MATKDILYLVDVVQLVMNGDLDLYEITVADNEILIRLHKPEDKPKRSRKKIKS